MPDIGTYQEFPQPQGRPPRLFEIAINVMGQYWITRRGFERIAEHLGYGVDYLADTKIVTVTLRRGERIVGQQTRRLEPTGENAVLGERNRVAAMRELLHALLKEHCPEAIRLAGEIIARRA